MGNNTIGFRLSKDGDFITDISLSLEQLVIPKGVKGILFDEDSSDIYEFVMGRAKLRSLFLPESFCIVDDDLLVILQNLESLSIDEKNPELVEIDGALIRKKDNSLINVIQGLDSSCYRIPEGVVSIDETAFFLRPVKSIVIPRSVSTIAPEALSIYDLEEILVDKENTSFSSENGVLYNANKSSLVRVPINSSITDLIVPESVIEIQNYALSNCKNIKSLVFPSSIQRIGVGAFEGCHLPEDIQIPSIEIIEDDCFKGCSWWNNEIRIPEGVKHIGKNAFSKSAYGANYVKNLIFPNSLETIDEFAFSGFEMLLSISIPRGLKSLHPTAFHKCKNLSQIDVDSRNDYFVSTLGGVLYSKDVETLIRVPAGLRNTSFDVPSSVRIIMDDAFSDNTELGKVSLPNTLLKIGTGAFSGCVSLREIDIPYGVTELENDTFLNCKSLSVIDFPNTVKRLGDNCFKGCTSLSDIDLSNCLVDIGKSAFEGCSALSSVVLPPGLVTMGESAFKGCNSLKEIDIPYGISRLEDMTFSGCSNLTIVSSIPPNLSFLGFSVFEGCYSLTEMSLPEGVKSIKNNTFKDCHRLESVSFPGVEKIGKRAFESCHQLRQICLPAGLRVIGSFAFHCAGLKTIFIPTSVEHIGNHAFCNCPIEEYIVEEGNAKFDSLDGCLLERVYNNNPNDTFHLSLLKYPEKSECNAYEVPSGVAALGSCAFKNCSTLKDIVLPDSLQDLGVVQTFYGCSSLLKIILPKSVRCIPQHCFGSCENLQSISILNAEGLEIRDKAFDRCTNLQEIHLQIMNADSILVEMDAIPESLFEKCILFIPAGTRWSYRHHPIFGKFKSIVLDK